MAFLLLHNYTDFISTVMVIITNTSSYLSVEPMMSDHNEITPEQIILNLNTPN